MTALKYWREIALLVVFIGAATFFGLWRYEVLDHKTTKDYLAIVQKANLQHEKNITITEEATNAYQADIDRLNADVKRLRLRPAKCISVAREASLHPEQGPGREYGSQNGVSSTFLYDFAIEAETLRIERNACKDFVNQVWEGRQ